MAVGSPTARRSSCGACACASMDITSPSGWPRFGYITQTFQRLSIDLLDHDLFADHEPWEVFGELQREAPVYRHPEPNGRGFWAVTKYDDVLAVLRDTKTFSSEVGGSATIEDLPEDILDARRNFLEFDPPKHGRYRRLISKNFTPGNVGMYEEWLRELVSHRLDRAVAVGELAYSGEREEDRFKPFGSPWADELCALGREYYAERRECPRDDVLTLIANAEIDGEPLSPRDLDNTFALLIVAGNETTRQAIALGTLALAQNTEEYDRLRAEPELVRSATEELLRYSSPVWFFRRTATCDTTIRDVEIAAGDKVVVWFAAGNRDPEHYPDPHRLDLARNPTDHLTFGRGGPHICLGAHLARLEVRVYLEELIPRAARIETTGEPVRQRSNFTNGLSRLPVRFITP